MRWLTCLDFPDPLCDDPLSLGDLRAIDGVLESLIPLAEVTIAGRQDIIILLVTTLHGKNVPRSDYSVV